MKKLFEEIKRLFNWLWAKRSEAAQLDYRDAFMGHLVLEIMQTSIKNEFKLIKLHESRAIHPTDNRENTIKATNERAELIREQKETLLQNPMFSKEVIAELMPSATYIRAIEDGKGGYFTFEGNGRVAALKQVFDPQDEVEIEVDLYHPKKLKRSQKKIRKLRKMHRMND